MPVYRFFAKIPEGTVCTTMIERAEMTMEGTQIVSQNMARRMIKKEEKQRNILRETKMQKVCTLASGCSIIAYKETEGRRRYELVRLRGNEVDTIIPSKRVWTFPINAVCWFYEDKKNDNIKQTMEESKRVKARKQTEGTNHTTT